MDKVTLAKNQLRAENWRGLISACQQSGQTVINWCAQNCINVKTYYYWLRKLRARELEEKELLLPVPEQKQVVFKQLEIQAPVAGTQAAVIIRLPSATVEVAEGTSLSTIEAVLTALKCLC